MLQDWIGRSDKEICFYLYVEGSQQEIKDEQDQKVNQGTFNGKKPE